MTGLNFSSSGKRVMESGDFDTREPRRRLGEGPTEGGPRS